jgi:hypothetical protein
MYSTKREEQSDQPHLRRIGRPRLRWDNVRQDLGRMKIQNRSKRAIDREAWDSTAEQAEVHKQV